MKKFYVLFLLSICLVTFAAQANRDYSFIGKPSSTAKEAGKFAEEMVATPLFVKSVNLFWKLSIAKGLDPLVVYMQAAKVTEFGYSMYGFNTGGITKHGNSGELAIFGSLEDGIKAQIDHLALYGGVSGYPLNNTKDPRHYSWLLGKVKTVLGLNNTWGDSEYGSDLVDLINQFHSRDKQQIISEKSTVRTVIDNYDQLSILGDPSITLEELKVWAKSKKTEPYFIELADIFWKKSIAVGVNPVVAYCQAAKETGWGRFGGLVKKEYKNTCGLKVRYPNKKESSSDFKQFDSWEDGIEAHVDHLALYAGAFGFPKERNETKDPRHDKSLHGKAKAVTDLGNGVWATDPDYGRSLSQMIEGINKVLLSDLKQ